jgi:phosphopantothenoylcysteine decarboxylase/phosphopantothenate--cysteine ligase
LREEGDFFFFWRRVLVNTPKHVILGVTGSIAAYKSALIASGLKRAGVCVHCVMTRAAQHFITPLTLRTITGEVVHTDLFEAGEVQTPKHIDLARDADLVLIAPATANIISKLNCGIADDLLSTIVLATRAPVLIAPAMNEGMYSNMVLQENILGLKKRGFSFIGPVEGELACGATGKGRLADIDKIIEEAMRLLSEKDRRKGALAGKKMLVTSGPTYEPIDPVRFIGNRSSGKMGFAMAEVARDRGAKVRLVSGPTLLEPPSGVDVFWVETALEMKREVMRHFGEADIVVFCAAVSDYRPKRRRRDKIKKADEGISLDLVRNPDILKDLGAIKGKRVLCGFAAETHDLIENAKLKLREKNLDLIVANDVSQKGVGFSSDTNKVTIITRDGERIDLPEMKKHLVADKVLDVILRYVQ